MALEIIEAPKIPISKIEAPKYKLKAVGILSKIEQKKESLSIGKVWTNLETKVVKSIPCVVPYKILQIMQSLEQRLSVKHIEYGMLLKGKIIDKQLVIEETFLPAKQEVTSGTVHFVQDDASFNGVIHRHPDGVLNFSGTDETYINQNFEFSILYVNHQITKGILNVEVKNFGRMRLELDIQIEYPDVPEIQQFKDKIFVREYERVQKPKSGQDLFSLVKGGFNFKTRDGKLDIDESVEPPDIFENNTLEEINNEENEGLNLDDEDDEDDGLTNVEILNQLEEEHNNRPNCDEKIHGIHGFH